MSDESRALLARVAVLTSLLTLGVASFPRPGLAAVGDQLGTITPTANTTVDNILADPVCGISGGSSIAIVQGSKLAKVDGALYPVLLAITCLDNTSLDKRSRV